MTNERKHRRTVWWICTKSFVGPVHSTAGQHTKFEKCSSYLSWDIQLTRICEQTGPNGRKYVFHNAETQIRLNMCLYRTKKIKIVPKLSFKSISNFKTIFRIFILIPALVFGGERWSVSLLFLLWHILNTISLLQPSLGIKPSYLPLSPRRPLILNRPRDSSASRNPSYTAEKEDSQLLIERNF